MTNPLDKASPTRIGNQGFANMEIGETRTVLMPTVWSDKGIPDLSSAVPYTMTRTARPFIYDWVGSVSNPSLDRKGKRDIRWVVGGDENAHLVTAKEASRIANLPRPR